MSKIKLNSSGINVLVSRILTNLNSSEPLLVINNNNNIKPITNEELSQKIHPNSDWILINENNESSIGMSITDMKSDTTIENLFDVIKINSIKRNFSGLKFKKSMSILNPKFIPAFEINWLY